MEVFEPLEGLFMFSTYVPPINLAFNQFLLMGEEPLLVHAGTAPQAAEVSARVAQTLAGRPLSYIFVSHFESDECGGLAQLLGRFPGARPLCGAVTARQLAGFGITGDAVVKAPGEALGGDGLQLEFLSYPSEVHLWEGLMAFEPRRAILFSGDLFIRFGQVEQPMVATRWSQEVQTIGEDRIPSTAAREALLRSLGQVPVRFIAPGHGPVLEVQPRT